MFPPILSFRIIYEEFHTKRVKMPGKQKIHRIKDRNYYDNCLLYFYFIYVLYIYFS